MADHLSHERGIVVQLYPLPPQKMPIRISTFSLISGKLEPLSIIWFGLLRITFYGLLSKERAEIKGKTCGLVWDFWCSIGLSKQKVYTRAIDDASSQVYLFPHETKGAEF